MTILDTARAAAALSRSVLGAHGLDYRSVGTKQLTLSNGVSKETGYWSDPSSVSSKPPRWILHLVDEDEGARVRLASASDGPLAGAATPGYINNGQGKAAIVAVRVLVAVKLGPDRFVFPPGWEWIVQFAFPSALPIGTSSDTLTEFSVERGTVLYKGRNANKREYSIGRIFIHPAPSDENDRLEPLGDLDLTYRQATRALVTFLSDGPTPVSVLRLDGPDDVEQFVSELSALYLVGGTPDVDERVYESLLQRIGAGERHFLFQLAPGIYRVAPPLATSLTALSSTSMAPGEEIE